MDNIEVELNEEKIGRSERRGPRLMRSCGKGRNRAGITLVELAIVLLVLGIIMSIVYAFVDFGIADDAVRTALQTQETTITMTVERYEMDNPPLEDGQSLEFLTIQSDEHPTWRPLKPSAVQDPWKQFYVIRYIEGKRQICSLGKDKREGGEGKNADFCVTDRSTWPDIWLGKKKQQP